MNEFINKQFAPILQELLQDQFQLSALMIIVAVFILSLIFLIFGNHKNQGGTFHFATIAPNILTSIGVFFTFLGIWIALISFDVNSINESIPNLLDGLKLAFSSSVFGLASSVLLRILRVPIVSLRSVKSAGEIGTDDLYFQLQELNQNSQSMREALVGDGEMSLSTQFGKLRNDFRDFADKTRGDDIYSQLQELNQNSLSVREALVGNGEASLSTQFSKLRNDFRDFADKMKEDGTQSLVKALEEVIKDFNEKISEQFGENFKQLNEAVGSLLEWQERYKEQVEILTFAFQETQKGIVDIEQSTAKIPAHMESVETAFNKTETRVEQLYKGLESLSAMRESAEKAVPELQQFIESMTANIKESMEGQIETLKSHVAQELGTLTEFVEIQLEGLEKAHSNSKETFAVQKETMEEQIEILKEYRKKKLEDFKEMQEAQSASTEKIKSLTENLEKMIQTSLDDTKETFTMQIDKFQGVLKSFDEGADNVLAATEKVASKTDNIMEDFLTKQEGLSKEIQASINQSHADNVEVMNQGLKALDVGMQEQVQRVLDKMANNLTSITERFVETYEKNAKKILELTTSITKQDD